MDLDATVSSSGPPRAKVKLRVGEGVAEAQAGGDGVVDATYNAIAELVTKSGGVAPQLERYAVKAITVGTDAQGEVSCMLRAGQTAAMGQSSHTDIVVASAHAYIAALNKLEYLRAHRSSDAGAPETGP